MINKLTNRIRSIVSSRGFFSFVIIFFILESAWIALTALYPQAFDEQFHFGLIKLYSHHLWPFMSSQPAGGNQFGTVARDSSYLYHYLMSFPYRLIELIFKSQTAQVISLRLIDIILFAWGLTLFRKILLKFKLSKAVSNLSIFIFALIPIVPQLAGQISYDDLMIPLTAAVILLAFKLVDQIKAKKPSFKLTAGLAILCLLNSLVMYAFLPIFLAIVLFFIIYTWRIYRANVKEFFTGLYSNLKQQSLMYKIVLSLVLVISIAMFAQRDLVNLVDYHSLNPSCSKILSVNACKEYYVFKSDYARHLSVLAGSTYPSSNVVVYAFEWLYWMWYRLFFAVSGATSGYVNYPPLPLPSAAALVLGVIGIVTVIKYRRQVFKANAYSVLLLAAIAIYTIALFAQGYSTYQYTAVLENMNGRYLLPILLLAAALIGKALTVAFKGKPAKLKILFAVVIVLLFLEGGGVLTYISRSDDTWYFNNSTAVKVNHAAKKITKRVILSGPIKYSTSHWFFN